MRSRLRKYVSVVMTLLLCLGLWFQHGQMVKAEVSATGAIYVYIMGQTEDGTTGVIDEMEIGTLTVNNFSGSEADGYNGTITLTAEQTKGTTIYSGYLLYWYKMENDILVSVAEGCTPTIDINDLTDVVVTPVEDEAGNITSYTVTGVIYAEYGASHMATYISNYDMAGDSTDSVTVPYYQDDLKVTEGTYSHPVEPTFWGETEPVTWTKEGYLFAGWGITDSGGVNAPTTFSYIDRTQTDVTFYAQWQEAAILDIFYYEDEENIDTVISSDTVTQSNVSDTVFTFTTAEAPERENYFFMGWSYEDEDGTIQTVPAGTVVEMAIPEDGSAVEIDIYGTWTKAKSLTVEYISYEGLEGYSEVIYQRTVDDTTFSFTTAEAPEPQSENMIFEGWSYTGSDGNIVTIGAGETCSDIPVDTTEITLTAVWPETLASGSTISSGTSTLQAGTPYVLGDGSWSVTYNGSSDSCTYASGSTFYVDTMGDYTFAGN